MRPLSRRQHLCRYCHANAVSCVGPDVDDQDTALVTHPHVEEIWLCRLHAAQWEEWAAHVTAGGEGPTPLSGVVWPPRRSVTNERPLFDKFRLQHQALPCTYCNRPAPVFARTGDLLCSVHASMRDDELAALERLR